MKNSFSKKDIGAAVVFAGFDGGSYSATIVNAEPQYVTIKYFPVSSQPVFTMVVRADWHRLTRFGNSLFLEVEAPTHEVSL